MTHAGFGQARQYAPVFWNEMLRPSPPTSDTAPVSAHDAQALIKRDPEEDVNHYYERVYV
jgi:hypothetical protein